MTYELKNMKQMSQKAGLTQTELAKLASVSQSIITKIERGALEPSYSIAMKLFRILDEQITKEQKIMQAKDILTRKVTVVKYSDTIETAIAFMKKHAISQLPVVKNNLIIGSISEATFIKNYDKIKNTNMRVEYIMDEPFPSMPDNTNIKLVREVLKIFNAVIITKNGEPKGIITKADLLKRLR